MIKVDEGIYTCVITDQNISWSKSLNDTTIFTALQIMASIMTEIHINTGLKLDDIQHDVRVFSQKMIENKDSISANELHTERNSK